MTAPTPLYGVTPAGFVAQPLQSILADLQSAWLADVDPTADLSPTSPEGQWLGILANRYAALWELAQAAWDAYDRGEVEGAGLDNLGDLIGIPREGPSFTQVTANLTLDPTLAPYLAGTLIANVVGIPALTFSNLGDVTAIDIEGDVATGVTMQATTNGPTGAITPGTLTEITTPVNGWTAITNPLAQSQLGTNVELDPDYVLRQVEEIASDGAATSPSTVAALYVLFASYYGGRGQEGPYSAKYYQNTGVTPITLGGTLTLPGHTFTVVVYDPKNLVPATGPATALPGSGQGSFAATIWQNRPSGIRSIGAVSAPVEDPFLGLQTVSWNVPTPVALTINAAVAIYPGQTWATVADAIVDALVSAAIAATPSTLIPPVGQLTPGAPVAGSQLEAVIMSVPGVFEVFALTFGGAGFRGSPDPTANDTLIPVSPLQVATIAAAGVNLTQATYP